MFLDGQILHPCLEGLIERTASFFTTYIFLALYFICIGFFYIEYSEPITESSQIIGILVTKFFTQNSLSLSY